MKNRTVIAISSLLLAAAALAADPPTLVNYQGVLRDASDKPRNGTFDMVFRFFDAATAGNEILVDSHTGGGGNAVAVTGGLFDVQLGGGTVTDGSGAGAYTSLDQVFRDFGATYLQITVGGEVLSPRLRVQSSAYALNASNLQGKPASGFVDTSASTQTKAGHLVVNGGLETSVASGIALNATGTQTGGAFGANGAFAYVADTGVIKTGIRAQGDDAGGWFRNNNTVDEAWLGYNHIGVSAHGSSGGGYLYDNSGDYADVGSGGYGVYGHGTATGGYFENTQVSINLATGSIGAYASGAPGARFVSRSGFGTIDLGSGDFGAMGYGAYPGAGGYFADSTYSGKSWIGFGDEGIYGIGNYAGGFFTRAYHNVNAYLGSSDYFGNPTAIYGYSNEPGGFPGFFRDDYYGNYAWVGSAGSKITGTGGVSFIQNHPTDPSRTIVYTAPEGDEVAVYTRGSGRLVHGEARVTLGETFALVANPDIGLTGTVTPIGDAVPLAIVEKSTHVIVVRGPADSDAEFDYMVWGLRIGFEDRAVVQVRRHDASIPSHRVEEDEYDKAPELRSYSALSRFTRMHQALTGRAEAPDLTASKALEAAIHVYDPATDAVGPHKNAPEPKAPVATPPPPARIATPQPVVETTRMGAIAPDIGIHEGGSSALVETFPPNTTPVAVEETVAAGDVIASDGARPGDLRRAVRAADPGVVGIVAGAASVVWTETAPLALPGTIVACRVDASYGAIAMNDLLVASATPGYAMRAGENPSQGTVVGKALEPLPSGTGLIRVLVMTR
ncbi:MAG TPA: hypothetical protein VFV19_10400 [Candidatus Polarisedimenticolaceae bacterium]|nr:hypothetical protein [Candidatus Polarisedimenticolaceae bacterium]